MRNILCADGCPCMESCPILHAMNMLGGKWKIAILCALNLNGCTRYNILKKKVRGISNTMLASSLKELEKDGLVKRREYLDVPVRVEYELTENCNLLFPAFDAIAKWDEFMQEKQTDKNPIANMEDL